MEQLKQEYEKKPEKAIIKDGKPTGKKELNEDYRNLQLDFADPRIVLFYGRNSFSEDTKKRNEKADMMNSKGTAYITSSQINNEHTEHSDDADNQSPSSCPACDNCYDFCSDLRNKRANPPGNLTIATDTGEGVITVPNNLHLAKFTGNIIGEVLASDKPVLLFLVDKDHHGTPVGRPKREVFEEELPECYNENPHLLNHSAVHFFFQKKLTTGGNLRHLDVRRRNGRLVLVYEIITRSSVSGILYQFRSGEIFAGKKFSEGINLPNQSGSGLAAIKLMGVKEKKEQGKDKPENEQQTGRKAKSTNKVVSERIVEPAIFYSNTVDFSYDFWEFANRCVANPFMIRFEHSETLYNNLINNNDKSPIQNIQCRFSAFKQAVKVGYWQGKVDLFFDIDNILSDTCKRVAQGQEDVDVITHTHTETEELLNADMTNADYGIEDYIGSQDANI
ncbi:6865_t:CDS:2 [Entrophospora sp. SA101]|nr:6865_t:CDS:2 [Entrophospora sp. SA101]